MTSSEQSAVPVVVPLKISSVEDTVYETLRAEIGGLQFAPNERLRLEELAARYGVSLTPVRHALRRLESEGLVANVLRKGAHVSPLTVDELELIQYTRCGLESPLARWGAQNSTDESLVEMAEQRLEMEAAYRNHDLESYVSCFWSFRDACYRRAGRPRLLAAVAAERIKVTRYILFLCRDVEAAAGLREPPDKLLDACRARDGETAASSTRAALLSVLDDLRTQITAGQGRGPG